MLAYIGHVQGIFDEVFVGQVTGDLELWCRWVIVIGNVELVC